MKNADMFRAAVELPDPEPYDEIGSEHEEMSYCPNCATWTALLDGVTLYCRDCGALWERTDHILTPAEANLMFDAIEGKVP